MIHNPTQFVVCDFDGTLFDTAQRTGTTVNVEDAYVFALEQIFGEGRGQQIYTAVGGLLSRAPSEFVRDILIMQPDLLARTSHNGDNAEHDITEALIRIKSEALLANIRRLPDGTMWPPPTNGADDFMRWIGEQDHLAFGIISSGHTPFIEKAFEVAALPPPDITITEDEIRGKRFPQEMERRVKPGTFPFALAHRWWLQQQGVWPDSCSFARKSKKNIVYFGNHEKDAGMARCSGVVFGHHRLPASEDLLLNDAGFSFDDWRRVVKALGEAESELRDGYPIGEILCASSFSTVEG